jgi:hypothetical protein
MLNTPGNFDIIREKLSKERIMGEKSQKPVYEKPCVYHLNDYKSGKGDCLGPGSGDGTFCSPGNSAGSVCANDGNSASDVCDFSGNSGGAI